MYLHVSQCWYPTRSQSLSKMMREIPIDPNPSVWSNTGLIPK
jgi:hypothetical protein